MKSAVSTARAAAVSASLAALFLAVYGSCNWIAAHRLHVGSLYFNWERKIPFVPQLIPAYLSLDLFFIGAPFLCLTTDELRRYWRRVGSAIVIAGIFFLVLPLRFGFSRPDAGGVIGALFDWFRDIDAPYNLVPSLHAALLLLVGDLYIRHLGGALRIAAIGWFVLIGVSPVLTYQHHVIDIVCGFALAGYCFYLVRDAAELANGQRNYQVGSYYGLAAFTLLVLALLVRSWAIALVWPTIALAVLAVAYGGFGSNVYRKVGGRVPWSTWFVLWPCLLGQQLSLFYYRRRCPAWDAITPAVWIGRQLSQNEAIQAVRHGVRSVLDVTAEFSEPAAFLGLEYRNVPVLDLTAPSPAQLMEMATFISNQALAGIVYVHCKIGYSRSAAAVAAYLLRSGRAQTVEQALESVRRARPTVAIRPEIVAALRQFASHHQPSVAERFILASPVDALA
jgi:protein-tyrosine phosphatase